MTTTEAIKAIDDEIKRQEAELQRLREERAAIAQEENQVDKIFDAVLNCPHSITHESVTLHFYPRQAGHNALAQLRHRLAAYDPPCSTPAGDAAAGRDRGARALGTECFEATGGGDSTAGTSSGQHHRPKPRTV